MHILFQSVFSFLGGRIGIDGQEDVTSLRDIIKKSTRHCGMFRIRVFRKAYKMQKLFDTSLHVTGVTIAGRWHERGEILLKKQSNQ